MGENSGKVKVWVMNADDIAGLTAEQIKEKFSLPQRPEYICDVAVPHGAALEVSSANGILGGSGGGIQYKFISAYKEDWFTNGRRLS